jgi:hypothetical protein
MEAEQMIVVGLTGAAGVGKDTVADYLVTRYGYEKVSFAAPLKRVLLQQDPIIGMDLFRPGSPVHLSTAIDRYTEEGVKKVFPLYRKYLEKLGTEGIREEDPDFWIKAASKSLTDPLGKYVFTDVRFPNEAEFIGDCRGSLWQVDGPQRRDSPGTHVSNSWAGKLGEAFYLLNNGSIDKLYTEADYVLGLMNWKYAVNAA